MKARRSIRSPRRRQYPGSHPRSSHPPSPMYVLMVSPTPACRVAEGRAASNIWSRLGRVCGTNHTDRGCRDGGHFEIEHIRIGDGEMDPACGKSLLRQSSTATDRFRNLTPAIGPRPWERVFMSSRPEDSHLRALPDPYVNLSIHTAPDVRPFPWQSCQWAKSVGFTRRSRSNQSRAPLVFRRNRLNLRRAQRMT